MANKKRQLEKRRRAIESREKKKATTKENPFELRQNRIKHNAIGRRIGKNEHGKPGQARSRAVALRKDTLLVEYMRKHKSGQGLRDARIRDEEGGAVARKTAVLKPYQNDQFGQEKIILTHKGKRLDQHQEDNPFEDDDDDGNIFERADFIETAHFGGGVDGAPKSTDQILDELIQEKRERKAEREATIEMTEKLDKDWCQVRNLIRHKSSADETDNEKSDYDILVKQLMFDIKSPMEQNRASTNKLVDEMLKKDRNDLKIEAEKEENVLQSSDKNVNNEKTNLQTEPGGIKLKGARPLPFILPMLEPKFDDLKKSSDSTRKKLEKKVKREFKGAQRDLRKDAQFLRNVWLKEIEDKDAERKRRVKKLFGDLQSERHQYKKKKS